MPSTFRIPKAPITGLYGRIMSVYARRTYGEIPDNAYVYFHHKPVLKAVLGFEGKVSKWDALDPTLKSYAQLASAGVIGCSWCLDFGYFLAHNDGLDLAKVREVPRWRESDVFTAAGARRPRVRRGDELDPADRHRRDGRRPDRPARRTGRRRADPDGRAGEHALAVQLRGRAAEPGLLGRLRAAPRRTVGSVETA